jgi:hypothetical protein
MATRAEKLAMIAGIESGEPNTAEEIRNILTALLDPSAGTIVIKDVSNAYISANFDGTGLGINEEDGYAICNGNNGTRNWAGRTFIAYGGTYLTMGEQLGSKDAVVVAHTHTVNGIRSYNDTFGVNGFYDRSNTAGSAGISTESTGVDGTGKNIQPSIVTLVTVKI